MFSCRVFTSIMFTALILGRSISSATDAAKAKVAASRIFKLLERESKIDQNNSNREIIVKITTLLFPVQIIVLHYHIVGHNCQC